MTPITTFAGRTVAVFGLGRSGLATCTALAAGGAAVVAADDTAESQRAAAAAGFDVEDLRQADWSRFAALVLAPGVPLTHPEPHWTVAQAKAAGIESVVFDRSGAPYHGKVKQFADAAREGGLKF